MKNEIIVLHNADDIDSSIVDTTSENNSIAVNIEKVNNQIDEYTEELYQRNKHTDAEISNLIADLSSKIENKYDVQLIGNLIIQLVGLNITNNSEITKLIKIKTDAVTKTLTSSGGSNKSKEQNDLGGTNTKALESLNLNDKVNLLTKYFKDSGLTNKKFEKIKNDINSVGK